MRFVVAIMLCACLPELPPSAALDIGFYSSPDAGLTTTPPPPPTDTGPRDIGFAELRVEGLNPQRGPAVGGTRVQLHGSGFLPDSLVELDGVTVRDILVVSSRVITFFSPAMPPGSVGLRIQNGYGTAELSDAFTYFQELRPERLEPPIGPLRGGIELRLVGAGLSAETVVLIGARPLVQQRMDGDDLIGILPPGDAPGAVDLRIADAFGQVHWRAAFTYRSRLMIRDVEPAQLEPETAATLTVIGAGFCAAPEVRVGDQICPTLVVSATAIDCAFGGHPEEAALDISVRCDGFEVRLEPGLLLLGADGPAQLVALRPREGAVAGGEAVRLLGRGLAGRSVLFGQERAEGLDQPGLWVRAPAASRPQTVAVSAAGAGSLDAAYRYRLALHLSELEPTAGSADGGDLVTLRGLGFCVDAEVRFAGVLQQLVEATGVHLTVRSSPHPGGRVVVQVRCGAQRAELVDGYYYRAELRLTGVSPSRGAQAGGTIVFMVGSGLSQPGLAVRFGAFPAAEVTVISDHLLQLRTPPAAAPGRVDVILVSAEEEVRATAGFTYFEPGFRYGGSRGGSPQGSVNVTVLNNWGQLTPVSGATVVVGGARAADSLRGETDARGQVTLSDPRLNGPQTVTVFKQGCDRARTLVDVDAADLTFWLGCPMPPSEGNGGGTPPPAPQPLIVTGRIRGFSKALFDPGTLGPNERAFAQVHLTQSSPNGGAPWVRGRDLIFEDEGEYRLILASGRYTLVAVAGVHNSRTQQVVRLTQLGFRRQVSGPPGEHLQHQDIHLRYPMDAVYGVSLGDRPEPLSSMDGGDRMLVRVALDFGGEGYFPLAHETSRGSFIALRSMPRVPADLLYISGGLVTGQGGGSPSTIIRRRGHGRIEGGITLGPLLPFAEMVAPRRAGAWLDDRVLRWKFAAGPIRPDYITVEVRNEQGDTWQLMLRGSQTKLRLPSFIGMGDGPGGAGAYYAQITAVSNPRFHFDNFSYLDTWFMTWQALSERSISFRLLER